MNNEQIHIDYADARVLVRPQVICAMFWGSALASRLSQCRWLGSFLRCVSGSMHRGRHSAVHCPTPFIEGMIRPWGH